MKHVNLSIQHVIMLNTYVVLSKQCLIMLRCYVVMLNACAVLSTVPRYVKTLSYYV